MYCIQDRSDEPTDYPFGWTLGIEAYSQQFDHHPSWMPGPIRRAFIKREFVAHTIDNPDSLATLDDYPLQRHWIQPPEAPKLILLPSQGRCPRAPGTYSTLFANR